MRIWVLDSNLFFKMVEGTDPVLQPALEKLGADADESGAHLAISAVTVQEYLVRPRTLGETECHKARGIVDQFTVLSGGRAAAEAADGPMAGMQVTGTSIVRV